MFFNSEESPKKLRMPLSLLWMAVLTISLLSLGGCAWFSATKDQPDSHSMEFHLKQGDCFKKIPNQIFLYIKQELQSANEFREVYSCIDTAIADFTKYTVGGREPLAYSPLELTRFLEKYVVQKEISPSFMSEIMKVKVGFVGGSTEKITKDEFNKIRDLLPFFEGLLLKLYPHWGVIRELALNSPAQGGGNSVSVNAFLSPLKATSSSSSDVVAPLDLAIQEFKVAIRVLWSRLNLKESHYSVNDFYKLIQEWERFDTQDTTKAVFSSESFLSQFKRHVESFKNIRFLAAGEPEEMKNLSEVPLVYEALLDGLKLVLQFKREVNFKEWTAVHGFNAWNAWILEVNHLLKKFFQFRKFPEIPLKYIDALLEDLYGRGLWLHPLKLETAKASYRQALTRFLGQRSESKGMLRESLELKHYEKIEREYMAYALIQETLQKLFQEESKKPVVVLRDEIKKRSLEKPWVSLDRFMKQQEVVSFEETWDQLLLLMSGPKVRHWTPDGKISIVVGTENSSWSYQELSYLNTIRLFTSLIMDSYGQGIDETKKDLQKSLDKTLGANQIGSMYSEFEQFGYELHFFDLRNENTAARSLLEADLFTLSGNGDLRVQFIELFDLFSILWSGGAVGVSQFKIFAQKENCELSQLDYFQEFYLQRECASQAFKKYFSELFPQFPRLSVYLRSLGFAAWSSFYKDLMDVSQVCPANSYGLETGDQRTMMVILHYVENLFTLFDVNRDGFFDEDELETAYPRFKEFFSEQPEVKKTFFPAESIFKFTVLKGYKPTHFWEITKFIASFDKGTADRQKLMRVLAALKGTSAKGNQSCDQ